MLNFFDLTNLHLYFALAISFVNAFVLCLEGYKFLQIIQLSGYHCRGYFEWLRTSKAVYVGRLALVAVLSLACFAVTDVILKAYGEFYAYLGIIFYLLFSGIYISNVYWTPQKTPLKMTNRMNRAVVLLWIVSLVFTFGLLVLTENFIPFCRLGGLALSPLLLPILVPFVHICMKPVEKAINRRFLKKAKVKLDKFGDLIKIGITGSFGKTSTKNFLSTILSEKYSVCATPFNFNTPLGITKTVIDYLEYGTQVFVAEMGARQIGDITELCELVQPKYGILTAVGVQHLATFKTLENIKKTKSELPKFLGEEGTCVFDIDDENVREIAENVSCKKIFVSLERDADVFASDIKTTLNGTEFTLHILDKTIKCKTKLLGLHNISNLLLCVGMAVVLNLSEEEIVQGIAKVMPVEHRLQMIKSENDVIILDDTYNSSIEGSKRALEVLSMYEGRRKIVITPGLVELGTMERLENYNFGKRISKVADIVIIVNQTHFVSIRQGLIDGGFDESKIYKAETLMATQDIIKEIVIKGDVILWENDLPDNYI